MNYQEKITKIDEKIKNKEFDSAEQDLLQVINDEQIKCIEDDRYIHYSFYNYIETLIYWRKYRPIKKILQPENNIADVYFLLGFINFETKNYGKAIKYLDKAIEWNPVSPRIRFEKADTFRNMGEIERYRVEIEKTYPYIYESSFMAEYYRELGWYYSEKRIFDLANALYTQSVSFLNTDLAKNELMYIAQQENREPRFSNKEEISKLFKEYNIPFGISNEITQFIYEDSQKLLKENRVKLANYLYRALYDITLDKRFMLYVDLKDEKTKIIVKIPEIWRTLNKEAYGKFGISDNTLFLFLTPQNENISVVCDGKCDAGQLDAAYKLNIENMKKQGANIEAEYSIIGQKNIKQVFALVKQKEKSVRIYQNYLVVNGYLINVSWEVPSDIPIEQIIEIENNSFKGQFIWSLKGENEDTSSQDIMNEINSRLNELLAQGMSTQEAMEIIFGSNPVFREIKEEFNNNGITPKVISALENLSIQIIKDVTQDPYWSDVSRDIFKLLILSNLLENKEFTLPDLVEQTNNVEFVKNIITKNLDKFNIPELQKNTNVKSILNSDKPLKSIVEIIHKSILPYERTELQKQGRKEMQEKGNDKKNISPISNKNIKVNEYSQIITGLPTFKFYFPESMGEYSKFNDNVFELKKDNIQKIRVMISKCASKENFEKDAKTWIEKNITDNHMIQVSYNKETIGGYPIEVYRLKTPQANNNRIYKIGYVNNCRITISGREIGNKEEIINKAFETLTWEKNETTNKTNTEITEKPKSNAIMVKCPVCNNEFKLNWNVPASEKTFYCKCPNCNAEIKKGNPNYKG